MAKADREMANFSVMSARAQRCAKRNLRLPYFNNHAASASSK
jgi:hypothetical protein